MKNSLTQRELSMFFFPLMLTSFLTVVTHSLFNAGMARLPSPEIMIAAFAVAKSLMMLFHSPTMMIRQSATALIDHRKNLRRPVMFLGMVVLIVTMVLALVAFTGLSRLLLRDAMGIAGQTLDEAVAILRVLVFFPLMVAFRDFFQALAIKFRMTPMITLSSVLRIGFVLLFISLLGRMAGVAPALLAGGMFLGAVIVEALALVVGNLLMVRSIPRALDRFNRERPAEADPERLRYGGIARFYIPLMMTTLIKTVVMPVINGGLARTSEPDLTISVFAVAWGLGMIVLSPFIMFHQVPLNFCDEPGRDGNAGVRRFALMLAAASSAAMLILAFTPLGYWVLTRLIGASHILAVQSAAVLKCMSILPFLMAGREYCWGVLMKRRRTQHIGKGKVVNLAGLFVTLGILLVFPPANAAVIGAVAFIGAELSELVFLVWILMKKDRTPAGL